MGADPIAVDLNRFGDESFRTYQADLSKSDALCGIPDNSVDLAHAKMFFTCPTIRYMGLDRDAKEILKPQLERVLKPGANFIYSA